MSVGFGLDKYCTIKDIKIEFNSVMLGEWFNVSAVGFDTYHVGSKIVFFGINERTVLKFLGIDQKKGKISHNILSPLHKLLYNIARRFILPQNSKQSEGSFVGYGGLLTWMFKKFGVPLDGLQFPMGPNMKIGAKCLHNLHLKLNDEEILVHAVEEVNDVESEEEKVEEVKEQLVEEEKDQESVPTATTETAETREKGEAASKRESKEKGDAMEDNDDYTLSSD
ncbi:uncharacterized protein LOC130807204 [Amaranthus tricolor]|uniref:uncharacterized protein LOC130807204 n=1 Tax=Amaranthus tricolor TaxID=29722 RepID=UPI00258DB907|nr:uncharacterized protein LOC130807204 [Amaranthus tricolor]